MSRSQKIKKIEKVSRNVFRDSLLPNGGLVAAPVHAPYFPRDAKSYMYSWPGRDGGFSLLAMLWLGEDHFEPVLNWIWEKAEDFAKSNVDWMEGLLFKSYHVNGRIREHEFQPDQGGTLLWAIGERIQASVSDKYGKRFPLSKEERELFEKVARKLAWGYEKIWKEDHFEIEIEDIWEERIPPGHKTNLTYSLAACSIGMRWVEKYFRKSPAKLGRGVNKSKKAERWEEIGDQMCKPILESACSDEYPHILRQCGGDSLLDKTLDASMLGLIWPFNCGIEKDLLERTVQQVEKNLVSSYGVHRYPDDRYKGAPDGDHEHKNELAGAWPLLTFWLSIALSKLGKKDKAKKYFNLVLDLVEDDGLIPEQFFCCERAPWLGIRPLVWSHAMFVFAAKELGYL